jgi:hypothetical protein
MGESHKILSIEAGSRGLYIYKVVQATETDGKQYDGKKQGGGGLYKIHLQSFVYFNIHLL